MIQIFAVIRRSILILLLYVMIGISLFSNYDNFYNVKVYGHQFTPNETATFVGIIGQMEAELGLVPANLANNNVSLAQNHASKADSLLTPRILVEIAEDNPRLAGDLRSAMIRLQSLSSSSESQVKSVSQLVSELNERLGEDASVRMAQVQPTSNFLEGVTTLLGNIFGGGDKEGKDQTTTLEALALANVIDGVLLNYGNAYHVGFDMTNMSNMVMIGNSSSPGSMVMNNPATGNNSGPSNMNMQSMNTSSDTITMTQHSGEMNAGYSSVNMSGYQSAQALAAKASEIFNTKLKHTTMSNNNKNVTAFVTNLDNGLTQLNDSISKKASPLDIMMIVHTQIHPNLLEAFNLQLRK